VQTKKGGHGTIGFSTLEAQFQQVLQGQVMIGFKRIAEPTVLAYQIQGKSPDNIPMADENADKPEAKKGKEKGKDMNVVLVSDIDFFDGRFFALREQGSDPDNPYSNMNLDNVTFVLNIIDSLASEDRFVDVRNRRRQHRTLSKVEKQVLALQDKIEEVRKDAEKKIRDQEDAGNKKIEDMIKELEAQLQKENPDLEAVLQERKRVQKEEQDKLNRVVARATRDANAQIKSTERQVGRDTRQLQDGYKLASVIVPPIPPLILAVVVFFVRRSREREGISRKRLK
jgi:ABC-2 type transport system permease protein